MVGSKAVTLSGPTNQEPANLASNVPLLLRSRCSICFFVGSLLGLLYPVQPCGRAVWHAVGEQLQGMPSRHATTATKRSWGGALLLRPVVVASARPHRAQLVVCLSQASPDPAGVVWCCASARPRRTQLVLVCASGTVLLFWLFSTVSLLWCFTVARTVTALSKWYGTAVALVALCQVLQWTAVTVF